MPGERAGQTLRQRARVGRRTPPLRTRRTHRRPTDWLNRQVAVAAMFVVFAVGLSGVLWQWRRAENNAAESRRKELSARENLYAADINQIQQALAADDLRQ